MAKPKVLVVDDDPKIVTLVRLYLEQEGYGVLVARDGLEALDTARQEQPDLIVLDLLLPQVDGLDVCRLLRAESQVPIIMLTARSMEDDKILGLDLGADDYVTKPFSPRELMARVRARLRHVGETDRQPDELRFDRLVIDRRAHEVRLDGQVVDVTPTEFKLLYTLASEPDRAYSRAELLDLVFGFDFEGFDRTVDVHVMNLRKKVEPNPKHPIYVKTVYGVGYKFSQG
jgi:DNA-binding response OmpR family regulator